jgi:hypothetical protein
LILYRGKSQQELRRLIDEANDRIDGLVQLARAAGTPVLEVQNTPETQSRAATEVAEFLFVKHARGLPSSAHSP